MLWNVSLAIAAALVQFINSWLGWKVTTTPGTLTSKQRTRYEFSFIGTGILGIVLIGVIAYRSGRSERAHFSVVARPAFRSSMFVVNEALAFNVYYTNVGGTATNLKVHTESYIGQDLQSTTEQQIISIFKHTLEGLPAGSGNGVMVRDQRIWKTARGPKLSPEDISNFRFGRRTPYVLARILYQDDFGQHERHFCQRLQPPSPDGVYVWNYCEDYNDEKDCGIMHSCK